MGCSTGFCGVSRAPAVEHNAGCADSDGSCCSSCAASKYRARMRAMLNPRNFQKNAGANPTPGSNVDSTPIDYWKGSGVDASAGGVTAGPGGTYQQSQDAAGYALAGQVVSQIGQTIRQQQVNDAAAAAQQANIAAAAAARNAMLANRSANQALTSGTSSGGSSALLLGALGIGALLLSGAVKMPK